MNVNQKIKFDTGRVENIVSKGENAGYQHFLLFPQCFQKASFSGLLKVGIEWQRVKGPVRACHTNLSIFIRRVPLERNYSKLPIISCLSPLPGDKILAVSKFKAFADEKFNITQNIRKKTLWEKEKILVTCILSFFS